MNYNNYNLVLKSLEITNKWVISRALAAVLAQKQLLKNGSV